MLKIKINRCHKRKKNAFMLYCIIRISSLNQNSFDKATSKVKLQMIGKLCQL